MAVRSGAKRPAEYVKGPQERGFKRIVSIDLDDPRFDAVFAYALETGADRPVQDAIRDLLLQATAELAVNPAILTARRQALKEARQLIGREIWRFLHELARDFQLGAESGDVNGVQGGGCSIVVDP